MEAAIPEEIARMKALIDDPRPGSKIEEAIKLGVDLYANLYNLSLSPIERIRHHQDALDYLHFWGVSYPRMPHLPGM
jgi:hypothetical protein